jgi:hypothetical protein
MKLFVDPLPGNNLFELNPQIVMGMEPDGQVGVFYQEGMSQPDRHFLVSLAEMALFAIEENDIQSLEFMNHAEIEIEKSGRIQKLNLALMVARFETGEFVCLILGDRGKARKLARQAIRSLTGRIRLDVP